MSGSTVVRFSENGGSQVSLRADTADILVRLPTA